MRSFALDLPYDLFKPGNPIQLVWGAVLGKDALGNLLPCKMPIGPLSREEESAVLLTEKFTLQSGMLLMSTEAMLMME